MAALLTARENGTVITGAALEEAVDRVVGGPRRKSRIISEHEKKITAYHEAGHTLAGWAMPDIEPIYKVTILARGRTGGGAARLAAHRGGGVATQQQAAQEEEPPVRPDVHQARQDAWRGLAWRDDGIGSSQERPAAAPAITVFRSLLASGHFLKFSKSENRIVFDSGLSSSSA